MADLGTAEVVPLLELLGSAGDPTPNMVAMTQGSATHVTTVNNRFELNPTDYRIAGTIDNSYHPPAIGQLWPRGDLDAIDPN